MTTILFNVNQQNRIVIDFDLINNLKNNNNNNNLLNNNNFNDSEHSRLFNSLVKSKSILINNNQH
jgi:hypothetical protein